MSADAGTDPAPTTRRLGISYLLVLLVLLALAPFIVLAAYQGAEDVQRQRAAVSDRARGQADEEAETMDDFLRLSERFLSTLADAPDVQALHTAGMEPLFHAVRSRNPNYENVFLVTATGEQIASTEPGVSDPQITERTYFRQALATGTLAISGVLAWPGTGRSVVVLAYPVTAPNGDRIAVLAVALNIARLGTVIGFTGLPDGSVVLLAQDDGTIIAASADTETWVGQSLASLPQFAKVRVTGSGLETLSLPAGGVYVTGYRALGRAPWTMFAAIPRAEVDAEARRSLVRVIQQLALAVLAAAVLAWIVLRRIVLPIRVLSEGARAFAVGYLNRRIPLQRRDELGELAGALNQMAGALERRLEEEAALAQRLRELNQLQTEFVATASHELRTPVTAIRSYAEALLRPDISDEQTRRACLEGIDRASERLAKLVRALLDVSRIDSGGVRVQIGRVDAAAVVQAAMRQAVPDAAHGAIEPIVEPGLPPVHADPERLEDVLANLIGNARKFSPPGAPVRVAARQEGTTILFTVTDHGIGIPEAEQERIFDRFYQVQRGADRQVGGSGLGLYIARGYVEAMGGRIWVESTPGQGSCFHVALPVAPRTTREEPEHDAEHSSIARR
jgi:signal transduction histidine kinase